MKLQERIPIGRTDCTVTPLGFGGAPLGNLYASLSDADAAATITAALDAGVTYFDTAPLYGYGLSEHRLGQVLRSRERGTFVLSTKVGRLLHADDPENIDPGLFRGCLPFRPEYDYSYDGVMRSVEDSLQRLGLNRIDILFIHDVDIWTHGSAEAMDARFEEVMEGGYRALVELRDEGTVAAIGAGLNEWEICQRFANEGDFDCFLLAGRYTLLEQAALDRFLPLCEQKGISVIIGGPYNTGILATGAVEGAYYDYAPAPSEILTKVALMERVCASHGVPLPAAALQFPLHHRRVAAVIPGARSQREVQRNRALFETKIPVELWSDLKEEGVLRQDAPTKS